MNFFIADTHFCHSNIIKYSNRPFKSIDEMNSIIINNWNSIIKQKDTVYVLGDFVFGTRNMWQEYCYKLNGKKILIIGNHDERNLTVTDMLKSGFDSVHSKLEIKIDDYNVLLSHYPYKSLINEYDKKFLDIMIEDKDQWLLHGHIHNFNKNIVNENMINVGVDLHNFSPISEIQILRLINDQNEKIRLENKKVIKLVYKAFDRDNCDDYDDAYYYIDEKNVYFKLNEVEKYTNYFEKKLREDNVSEDEIKLALKNGSYYKEIGELRDDQIITEIYMLLEE
jgi:calcineurin-like phosphoesterase family protein